MLKNITKVGDNSIRYILVVSLFSLFLLLFSPPPLTLFYVLILIHFPMQVYTLWNCPRDRRRVKDDENFNGTQDFYEEYEGAEGLTREARRGLRTSHLYEELLFDEVDQDERLRDRLCSDKARELFFAEPADPSLTGDIMRRPPHPKRYLATGPLRGKCVENQKQVSSDASGNAFALQFDESTGVWHYKKVRGVLKDEKPCELTWRGEKMALHGGVATDHRGALRLQGTPQHGGHFHLSDDAMKRAERGERKFVV